MEITFIRHAEKEELGEDPFLTKKGLEQAKHIAKRMESEKFDLFYCSDLKRAKQTAQEISNMIKVKPEVEPALNEFEAEMIKKSRNDWSKEEEEHYNKLMNFLNELTKKRDDDISVLIVAHGITNRILLSYFTGIEMKQLIGFRQSEGGMSSVYWTSKFKNWRLKMWNDNNHIPADLRYGKNSY